MRKEVRYHVHLQNSNQSVFGNRLEAGDVIEAGDVYASSDGTWKKAPCPGLTLQENCDICWIRPVKDNPK